MTTASPVLARRALGLGAFTVAYDVVEGVVAVVAGIAAGAVSLVGFGLDSGIEVISALIVVVRLSAEVRGAGPDERREKVALRAVAITFFVLAAYLVIVGTRDLIVGERPETSLVGIVLTASSIVIMPTLAWAKRRVGTAMGSALVVADAAETRLCEILSVTTFVSLLVSVFVGWNWLDAVAGFVIAVFAVMEGREAWEGELEHEHGEHER